MADKLTKKELKEPDSFQVAFWRLVNYASKNKKHVLFVSVFLSLLIIGSIGWFVYTGIYENRADELYRKAYAFDIQGGIRGGEQAVKAYKELTVSYPRSKAAQIANYRLGGLYFGQNRIEEAVNAYLTFLNTPGHDPDLAALAQSGLGYCYEVKGDLKNALVFFEKAIKNSKGDNQAMINHRNMARIYEMMNDKVKSVEHYRKALEKSKDPSQQLLLKRKIAEQS